LRQRTAVGGAVSGASCSAFSGIVGSDIVGSDIVWLSGVHALFQYTPIFLGNHNAFLEKITYVFNGG
ncbi:MAG: hypothetical protein V3R99_12695, partial [Thermoguttaceae bacterium]